MLHYGTVFVKI